MCIYLVSMFDIFCRNIFNISWITFTLDDLMQFESTTFYAHAIPHVFLGKFAVIRVNTCSQAVLCQHRWFIYLLLAPCVDRYKNVGKPTRLLKFFAHYFTWRLSVLVLINESDVLWVEEHNKHAFLLSLSLTIYNSSHAMFLSLSYK